MSKKFSYDVVHRWEGNPLLTIEDIPFPCNTVFNAACAKYNGQYILLLRVEDLVRVLQEPKNALLKQYQALFQLDGVDLVFTPQAIHAIATRASSMKTGARGLRATLEEVMLDLMYDVPALKHVKQVVITEQVIEGASLPELIYQKKGA